MDTEMDQVVDAALDRFLARMQGHYLPSAPLADKWAQAVAAAVVTEAPHLVPHIREIRAWLERAADDEDRRSRCIALVTLCDVLPHQDPREIALLRNSPVAFVNAARGLQNLDFTGDA